MNTQEKAEALKELKTLRDCLRFGTSVFNQAGLYYGHGTDNAWDEALVLCLHVLHLSDDLGAKILDARLTTSEKKRILDLFAERIIKRSPSPYLIQQAWFAGLPFFVDERVLIPRSPIAELIENYFSPWIDPEKITHILDIGTGSGCIAIACAYYFPEALVDGVDISLDALAVAKQNVAKHGCGEQIKLTQSDIYSALGTEQYDVIIANPPYVDAKDMAALPYEFHHEPKLALAAGDDGLDYMNKILKGASNHLNPQGILIGEVGNSQGALIAAYPELPFTWIEFERGGDGVFVLTREQLESFKH